MDVAVFGANGPTGRLVTKQVLARGHCVTAVTRHPDAFPIRHDRLRLVAGDVRDPATADAAVAGTDAVLSALGTPYSRKPITLYSVGTSNIVQAMRRSGVGRLACVSSSATDPADRSRDTGGGMFFERALKPIITMTLGRTLYADMLRMEQLVMTSELQWTIVRPSGLFGTAEITGYRTAESFIAGRYTSRADLADVLTRQLSESEYVRKAVAVATFDEQPTVWQLIRNEALGKKLDRTPAGR